MSSAAQNQFGGDFHLTYEQLLLQCDGELSGVDSGVAGSHLGACASCRGRLQELTEGVDAFLMFRRRVLVAAVPAPVHQWADLEAEFERIDHPWKARFDFAFSGFLSACRGLRYNMAAAVALLVLIFLIFQPWATTVSAAKLLARAIAAQSATLRSTREPVVYQRLRIQLNSGAAGARAITDYESWRDLQNGRFREAVSSVAAGVDSSGASIAELRRIYAVNHLDWQSPLSAEAYGRWSAGLAAGRASVARGHGDASGGGSWLVLTTVATAEPRGDEIGKAEFFVRASDWHPLAVHFSLKDREYEISEAAFQVVPLGQVDSSLFDGSAAGGAEQVESAAPGDRGRGVHGGGDVGRVRRSEQRKNTAHAPTGKSPATAGAANQKQPDATHEARPDAKSSAPAKSVRAETGAAEADTGMDLPLTLTYGVSTPLDQLTPGGGSRLNLGLPPAGMALNPGMAFAEQLARERAAMQQTVPQPPKPVAPGSKLPNPRRIGGHPIKSKTN